MLLIKPECREIHRTSHAGGLIITTMDGRIFTSKHINRVTQLILVESTWAYLWIQRCSRVSIEIMVTEHSQMLRSNLTLITKHSPWAATTATSTMMAI